ncbi:MarR family winged helix-turn-helix transcriptional regulator [Rhizosphaericola mali]|uniref:MarR family transcriptional regulator n=1 Tax=Rhizosphaericola mali TaxID=2545455 RepID=A0A5P2G611_9BACT|nr:MarR family transcriptional regulator [Rhizosphaericola mali]QES90717.1 MarR family transcriptional regulator [Rhizosphaericola mali]
MGFNSCLEHKEFRNDYHKMMVTLLATSAWMSDKMKCFLANEDITLQQFNILKILQENEKPLSILQIRQELIDKMSDASRIVDRLILKKLVKKQVCSTDKRLVDISLDKEGEELICRINQKMDQLDANCEHLNKEELNQLMNLLNKMRGDAKVAATETQHA